MIIITTYTVRTTKMVGTTHRYKTNDKTGKLMCPYCSDYEALKQSTMSEHVRQKHAEIANRPIVLAICPHSDCERKFSTKSLLRNHLASKAHARARLDKHSHISSSTIAALQAPPPPPPLKPRFSCEKCDACFAKRGQLITHFARSHLPNDKMIVHIDDDHSMCIHCSKILKKNPMMYHVGICNPASQFSKEFSCLIHDTDPAAPVAPSPQCVPLNVLTLMAIISQRIDLRIITLRAL